MLEDLFAKIAREASNAPVSFTAGLIAIITLVIRLSFGHAVQVKEVEATTKRTRNPRKLLICIFWATALSSLWVLISNFSIPLSVVMHPALFVMLAYLMWISGIYDNFGNEHAQIDAMACSSLAILLYFGVILDQVVRINSSAHDAFFIVITVLASVVFSIIYFSIYFHGISIQEEPSKDKEN